VTAAPQAEEPTPLRVAYTEFTLANGLHVILHADRSVPVVAVTSGISSDRDTRCPAAPALRTFSST
jgi:hypothetical protein